MGACGLIGFDWGCLPSPTYTLLSPRLACIILTERAVLILIPVIQEDMTVRTKIFILCDPWAADVQKSHSCLLFRTPLTCAGIRLTGAAHLRRLGAEAQLWTRRRTL